MLNSDFLEESLGIVSPPHLVYFLRKIFLMLYYFNRKNFVFLLIDKISIAMCIAIVCFPGCNVTNFEINLIFLIKWFFYMTKNSRQKFEYLGNEKRF